MSKIGTKSWHLNDAIKKLLLDVYTPIVPPEPNDKYYIDDTIDTMMHAPDTDAFDVDTFIYQSGKGLVTDHNLNLDTDV